MSINTPQCRQTEMNTSPDYGGRSTMGIWKPHLTSTLELMARLRPSDVAYQSELEAQTEKYIKKKTFSGNRTPFTLENGKNNVIMSCLQLKTRRGHANWRKMNGLSNRGLFVNLAKVAQVEIAFEDLQTRADERLCELAPKMDSLFTELGVSKLVPPELVWQFWHSIKTLVHQTEDMTEQQWQDSKSSIAQDVELWRLKETERFHADLLRQRALVAARFKGVEAVTAQALSPTTQLHTTQFTANERIAHLEIISTRFESDEDAEWHDEEGDADPTMSWEEALHQAVPQDFFGDGDWVDPAFHVSADFLAAWWTVLKAAQLPEDTPDVRNKLNSLGTAFFCN
ncbi:hypothetical protein OIO90_002744 [Microbotryomycetes sp. JL221]|nr:hypothetical protein OIO90_002744 [Microbotryomycetes sp. JL221]